MIDDKDIEIAKLKGQVEALERMIKQLATSPTIPQFIPVPYQVPTINIAPTWQPPHYPWTITSTSPSYRSVEQQICDPNLYFINNGIASS